MDCEIAMLLWNGHRRHFVFWGIMRESDAPKDGIHDKSGQPTGAHDEDGAGLPLSQRQEGAGEDDDGRHIDALDGSTGRG